MNQGEPLHELALFAGAGGGILGGKLLGWRTVCAVEVNPYCRGILVRRQNEGVIEPFPIWDDVRTFDADEWAGSVDLVSSGFPCQRHSTIGNIHGSEYFDGWPDTARIVKGCQPRFVWIENVPGVLRHGWDVVLLALADLGYDVRWGVFSCLDAATNAPQQGKRLFALATASCNGLEAAGSILAKCSEVWKPALPAAAISATWAQGIPEPTIPQLPDGLAAYVGELTSIGQGQVPAVVRLAWETLRP